MYVSVYLNLSPQDRADRPPRFIISFKTLSKKFKDFVREKNLQDMFKDVSEDFEKIEEFLSHPDNLKSKEGIPVRGIAIFSNTRENYWEVVHLPYVIRNILVVDVEPYKRWIFAVETDFGKNLVVHFSKRKLNMWMIDAREIKTIYEEFDFFSKVERPATFKYAAGNIPAYRTTGTKNFEVIKFEEEARIAKFISDTIFEIYKTEKFNNLFLSSADKKSIPMVVNSLHNYVKHTYRGELNISNSFNKTEVYNVLLDKINEIDEENEHHLANRFEEMLALEMAVKGIEPAITMAMIGNVETLIVDSEFSREGFVCYPSGFYGVSGECPESSDTVVLIPDITNRLIEEALKLGARVEIANTERLRSVIDRGVGVIMRWKVETAM